GPRHGQLDDAELASGFGGRFAEAAKIVGQRLVVGVGRIGLGGAHDDIRRDEAGNVVHVAVGVVADDSASQPDGVGHAQIFREGALQVFAGGAGIALLDIGEEALLGRQHRTEAVHVDAAAFQDHVGAVFADAGRKFGDLQMPGGTPGDGVVELPVVVLGPGVEAEVD